MPDGRFLTGREVTIEALGLYAVDAFAEVRRFNQELGHALAAALLARVGGRLPHDGERCDGVTHLGMWEFCLSAKSKNSAGDHADRLRHPGRCVQILDRPRGGWISGEEFLQLHGVDAAELAVVVRVVAEEIANRGRQLRLPI